MYSKFPDCGPHLSDELQLIAYGWLTQLTQLTHLMPEYFYIFRRLRGDLGCSCEVPYLSSNFVKTVLLLSFGSIIAIATSRFEYTQPFLVF